MFQEYREHLLERALQCLIGAGGDFKHENILEQNNNKTTKISQESNNLRSQSSDKLQCKEQDQNSDNGNNDNIVENNNNINGNITNGSQISDVLNYTKLLLDSLTLDTPIQTQNAINLLNLNNNNALCNDPLSYWWANLFNVAAYWLLGEDEQAEKLYQVINKIPSELFHSKDLIPVALLAAFNVKMAMR